MKTLLNTIYDTVVLKLGKPVGIWRQVGRAYKTIAVFFLGMEKCKGLWEGTASVPSQPNLPKLMRAL